MPEPRHAVLEVTDLKKHFPIKKGLLRRTAGHVYAVDGVSLTIRAGETLALVGESGCGKSTVGRAILRLIEPTAGRSRSTAPTSRISARRSCAPTAGRCRSSSRTRSPRSIRACRRATSSASRCACTASATPRSAARAVADIFRRVGLRAEHVDNYPHQFSGGQRQRIGIARALALEPSLIIGDEPVSALDVSIQAQILNLVMDLQDEFGLTYLFISHNLAVVEHISHHIAVMYLGRIVEYTDKKTLFTAPQHPYTESLLAAVPVPDPAIKRKKIVLQGDVPSPVKPPPGCHFHTRCPYAIDRCKVDDPALREVKPGQFVACHLALEYIPRMRPFRPDATVPARRHPRARSVAARRRQHAEPAARGFRRRGDQDRGPAQGRSAARLAHRRTSASTGRSMRATRRA